MRAANNIPTICTTSGGLLRLEIFDPIPSIGNCINALPAVDADPVIHLIAAVKVGTHLESGFEELLPAKSRYILNHLTRLDDEDPFVFRAPQLRIEPSINNLACSRDLGLKGWRCVSHLRAEESRA